jgi:hypothetical protein
LRDNELHQLCKVHNHLFASIKAHMGTVSQSIYLILRACKF